MDKLNSLIEKAKNDPNSLEILINKFNPIILKCAKIYCYNSEIYSDAIAEGTIALIKCVKKYPVDCKIPFPYYAKKAIYSRIKYYTSKEINRWDNLVSFDAKIKGCEDITIEDTLSCEDTLEEEYFKRISKLEILEAIASLKPIEKETVERHCFLGHSLRKISEDIDYSYRGIKYAKSRGIKKLIEKLKT